MDSVDWTDHFRVCSNELSTPRILLCPADVQNKAATNWASATGDANISYFVGTSASQERPQTIVLGDRNVTGSDGGLDARWSTFLGSSIDATWDRTLHVRQGNLSLAEGSVQQTKNETLRAQISAALASGVTNVVFSKPRGVL